jgi:hypothetical protein
MSSPRSQSAIKIKFVGAKDLRKPLRKIVDGKDLIMLPERQARPFSHPQWRQILAHAPHLYKKVIPKGK